MASFLDLFPAVDSFGARAARYKLYFLGSPYAHQESWFFGLVTGFFYVGYKYATVTANGLLGLVLSSGTWLEPLSEAYQRVTAPLYAYAPPWAIACCGMAIVGFSVMLSRPKTTAGGFFDSESLNRINTGLAMMVMVIILTHDPFAAIMNVLQAANSLSIDGSAALTGSANDTTITAGQSLVDNSIRTPTIALNYGGEFSDACKDQFSQAMQDGHALAESSGCFVKGQNAASPDTAGTALVMLIFPAIPMLVFAIIGAWKYVLHLTISVMCAVATAWVAASSVHKRRGFERLSETFARAGAHLLMAVITSAIAVGLPSLVSGLATKLLGLSTDADLQVFVLMISMGIGFMVSTYAIYRITSKHSALVRMLKADANTTLNRTLGIDTSPLRLEINRLNPFSKRFGEKEAASALAAPSSMLASDPLGVDGKEGAAAVKRQPSAKDAADVEQLLTPAESVAAAAGEPDTRDPMHVVLPDPASQSADSRAWQQALYPNPTNEPQPVDVFGYFAPLPQDPDARQLQDTAPEHDLVSATPTTPTREEQSLPNNVNDAVGVTEPEHAHLAPARRDSAEAVPDAPIVPVEGNLFVDPALNEAARSASATFAPAEHWPAAKRLGSVLRRFRTQDPIDPVPFSTPSVEHGAALSILTAQEMPSPVTAAAPEASLQVGPSSDQQQWNLRSRLGMRRKPVETPVTSPEALPQLPTSGLHAGQNVHPASFHAPMADFLAAEQLEADIEEATMTLAAAGQLVRVSLPANDSRLALRLTTDPDRRVVPVSGLGFGDPV
ncbi:hypothetical protein [Mycobacteroides abscessus]|uniref:hypothetical protein n=1 Tax=Mycobacteroides abscessus TaxID=36809 RepID=UPI0005E16787|nr:hypothetical protein [Mycobacteroides abscessus]CPW72857.1 Uncharacterised protein [Mycobacteroides abscessus]SKF61070.1 Uncharacterised protein [Mycobacteroides abscessus subsp. bolletii]SKH64855.1 Uncharacterised protein [Mycobacteroides abscessus subsp. bolletii]